MRDRLPWFAVVVIIGTVVAAPPALAGQPASADCMFILGFKTLKGLIDAAEGPATVGKCLENQRFDAHGNAEQRTTGGRMVWRKADNWTAFTDSYRTWANGPHGLAVRINGATAMMAGPDSTALGTVTLTQGPHGVLIAADLTGCRPAGTASTSTRSVPAHRPSRQPVDTTTPAVKDMASCMKAAFTPVTRRTSTPRPTERPAPICSPLP